MWLVGGLWVRTVVGYSLVPLLTRVLSLLICQDVMKSRHQPLPL